MTSHSIGLFLHDYYWTDTDLDHAGIDEFEHIRESLRDLIKYIPIVDRRYDIDFSDDILSSEWKESELEI